jgi:multiple antibiotic resistance protein
MGPIELFIAGFAVIFALSNPFALAVFYVGMTLGWENKDRNTVALRATIIAVGIAIGCILVGQAVLNLFGVTIPALQVAGGLIFMQMGFGMLNDDAGSGDAGEPVELSDRAKSNMAITPLAIPFLVGPGLIAVLLSVAANITSLNSLLGLIGGLLLGYATVYLGLRAASFFSRVLGDSGTAIMTKLLGLIVLSVGISLAVAGLVELLPGLA